jgi:DNA gyrase subunit A
MGRPAYGVRGMDLDKGDYIVGMAVNAKDAVEPSKANGKKKANGEDVEEEDSLSAEERYRLILSVTENGYGKRTDVHEYRLQSRGGKGVINVKTTERNGKVCSIMLVKEDSEVMVISHYGKIIRTPSAQIREAGRSTQGVRLLNLEPGDKVAAAVVIPPAEKEVNGTLLQ